MQRKFHFELLSRGKIPKHKKRQKELMCLCILGLCYWYEFLNVMKVPGRSKRESVKKIKYASSHAEGSQNETNSRKKGYQQR